MSHKIPPTPRSLIDLFGKAPLPTTLILGLLVAACSSSTQGRRSDDPDGLGSGGAADDTGGDSGSGGNPTNTGGQGVGGTSAGGTASGGTDGSGGGVQDGGTGGVDPGGSGGGQTETGGANGSGGDAGTDVVESAGCDATPTLQNGTVTIQSGGSDRTYALLIPDDYDNSHPYRLIFGFHGATGSSSDVAPSYFGLASLSQGSTIFIAPSAVGGIWDSASDTTLMDDILADVEADLCIDTTRVMLEGFSQGGAMAWTLACARPGVYRAAVVHSGGGLTRPATCEPIAFFSSLGQSESGGAGQTSNSDFFAGENGCTVESLAKASAGGHACSDYADCSEGHPTRWCDYDGGHTPAPADSGQGGSWMPAEVWDFLSQF